MVLKSSARLFGMVLLACSLFPARAAQVVATSSKDRLRRYIIKDSTCQYFEKSGEKWVKSKKSFNSGERYLGLPSERSPGKVLFRSGNSSIAVDARCVDVYKQNNFSFYGFVGFSTWRDEMQITDNDLGVSSPLRVNQAGLCAGMGVSLAKDWYDVGADSCLLIGKAHLTHLEDVAAINYSAVNASMLTIENQLHFLWVPPSGQVNFGFALPLFFKTGVWPVPAANYSVSPATSILYGFLLEARFDRGPFRFTQNVGFLKKPRNFLWNIQIGWVFF